jgi:hypothetical protein
MESEARTLPLGTLISKLISHKINEADCLRNDAVVEQDRQGKAIRIYEKAIDERWWSDDRKTGL